MVTPGSTVSGGGARAGAGSGSGSGAAVDGCWHCGLAVASVDPVEAEIAGARRPFCCIGCREAARWIAGAGLGDYYRLRDAAATTAELRPGIAAAEAPADHFVATTLANGHAEVILGVVGIRCAACAWLIERLLMGHVGVVSVTVNPVASRARIVFDPNRVAIDPLVLTLTRAGYRPLPLDDAALDDARGREARAAMKRLLVAGFGMMQAMMFAAVLYVGGESVEDATRSLFRWLGFAAASPVVLYSARPFFSGAARALAARTLSVDVPVAIAIALIYGASLAVALQGGREVYFDSVAMFVFFLLCGRHLEMRARHRSGDLGDAVARLAPTTAERRRPDGEVEPVPVAGLALGDRIVVATGAVIPADGRLESRRCRVDESLLTGESRPVVREAGAELVAGSLVVEGPIDLVVSRVGDATALAAIVTLVRRAQVARPRLARVGQRSAALFIVRVMLFASATAALWAWFDPPRAFDAALAVLVISCPCAFALAVPAALTRAMGVLATRGVLVVDPDAIEGLASADRIVFDKTGTLTDRAVAVTRIETVDPSLSVARARAVAAALGRGSRHPVAEAIVAADELAPRSGGARPVATDVTDRRGDGLEGDVEGRRLRLGRPGFVGGVGQARSDDGTVWLGTATSVLAVFTVVEAVKRDAEAAVSRLTALGLGAEIASGDAAARVAAVATEVGIADWAGRLSPTGKLARLEQLRAAGHRVVVVGDGINDAPVLAGADVSIALGGGAELAQASSSVVLVGSRLVPLADAVATARETLAILGQNQRWAMVYNFGAVPLAALGFVPPWLAALGMSTSSLLVVLNSLRIGRGIAGRRPTAARPGAPRRPRRHQPPCDVKVGVSTGGRS